jgi:hypothetical protein
MVCSSKLEFWAWAQPCDYSLDNIPGCPPTTKGYIVYFAPKPLDSRVVSIIWPASIIENHILERTIIDSSEEKAQKAKGKGNRALENCPAAKKPKLVTCFTTNNEALDNQVTSQHITVLAPMVDEPIPEPIDLNALCVSPSFVQQQYETFESELLNGSYKLDTSKCVMSVASVPTLALNHTHFTETNPSKHYNPSDYSLPSMEETLATIVPEFVQPINSWTNIISQDDSVDPGSMKLQSSRFDSEVDYTSSDYPASPPPPSNVLGDEAFGEMTSFYPMVSTQ